MSCALSLLAAASLASAPITISGKVVDVDGKPVPGASIDVADHLFVDGPKANEHHAGAKTGPDGSFTVQAGFEAAIARADAPGYAQVEAAFMNQWQHITRGQPLVFHLRKVLAVSGSVVDEAGKPIEGVMVAEESTERDASRWTDAQGHFTDVPLPHGTRALFVYRRGYQQQHLTFESSPVKIVLAKKPTVAVYLTDSAGKPLRGSWDVASFRSGGQRIASCTTRLEEADCTLEVELGEVHVKATAAGKTLEQTVTVKDAQKFDLRFRF